jgi:hypothetical protein
MLRVKGEMLCVLQKYVLGPDMVAHFCTASYSGDRLRGSQINASWQKVSKIPFQQTNWMW